MNKEAFISTAVQFLRLWNCEPDGEMVFTESSLLWPVTGAKEKLMLKIADPEDDEARAFEMLQLYEGRGAVRLIKSHNNAQILERISDDTGCPTLQAIALTGQDDAATGIICDVIAQLHAAAIAQKPPANLIPFRQRSDDLRKRTDEGTVRAEDRHIFQLACHLCNELIADTAETRMPLHGDIHHFNVLRSSHRGWLAIDPKGILGPRVYEYANTLCNPYMHTDFVAHPNRMDRQASIISERAELNKNLLIQFVFLHAMQCAAWSLDEPGEKHWIACARTAAILGKIKP